MEEFITENKPRMGLVSLEAPLISNLNVCGNIAMIKEYHQNLPRREAEKLALQYLRRYGMENTAYKRSPALTNRERFCVMLLRAAMVEDAIVVIDRPLTIMPDIKDASFIDEAIKKIDDLFAQCYIFDYKWNKERYRMDYAC
ncbi:MAG: hypothetical protein Q7J12_01515 [Syntrophales bacterium]|nr:hypothetical protein [Syntrophales bacterium]